MTGMNMDRQLMERVARGDGEAFQIIYQQHKRRVWGLCVRIMGDGPRAEDMAQETWVKVIKNASSYKPLAGLAAWICQVARNTCLNGLRSEKAGGFTFEELTGDEPADSQLDLEQTFSDLADRAVLSQAFASLPGQQRVILAMFVHEELSYAEIAREMKLSIGSVKQLIFRAKQNLRISLKEEA